jgi:Mrp family chromosome partitioning ATPase
MMLARLAARSGLTSAIVDADVQHPGLASRLGLEPTVGWTDALDGSATLAETMIQSTREPIAVVPTLRPLAQFAGLSGNLNVGMHLRMLRKQFELVVLDVGPLEETGQTTLIKSLTDDGNVDGVLLVRDVRHTGHEEADSLVECLRAASIPVWGVIENFTDAA